MTVIVWCGALWYDVITPPASIFTSYSDWFTTWCYWSTVDVFFVTNQITLFFSVVLETVPMAVFHWWFIGIVTFSMARRGWTRCSFASFPGAVLTLHTSVGTAGIVTLELAFLHAFTFPVAPFDVGKEIFLAFIFVPSFCGIFGEVGQHHVFRHIADI
jgi:hypothetical protein